MQMVQAAKSAVGVATSQNWSLSRRIPRWRGGFAKFTQNVTKFTQIDQNVTIFSAFVKFTQIVTIFRCLLPAAGFARRTPPGKTEKHKQVQTTYQFITL